MSFLDRIAECNTFDLAEFRPFIVAGVSVGWVRHEFAERLRTYAETLEIADGAVSLRRRFETFEERSAAMEAVLRELARQGIVTGWRDESYPVTTSFTAPPLLRMERAAVSHFGIRAYGVHLNGYVRRPDGLHMWIARRAGTKPTYPGMLDNMVAGGQPMGIGLADNLVKECREEAGIPETLARRSKPVGAITYCMAGQDGLKPDVQFCYDLELPPEFAPFNVDGEIEQFFLWPISRVAEIVRETREFKFNCSLVIIDFLVRHGVIAPDHPDYVDIARGLRR